MINKGDKVYAARIIPSCDIYEVIDLKIRTVVDNWFVGTESRTKQARMYFNSSLGKIVFKDRNDALAVVKEAEKQRVKKNFTKYEEEY